MSKRHLEKITCPKCKKESEFIIWESVNTMIDPEMKEKIRTGEAFQYVCPQCGDDFFINYGFLYHQMEDRMMIYYVQDMKSYDKVFDMFSGVAQPDMFRDMKEEHYLFRIVMTLEDLLEKLRIFDNGLDDRPIEVAKIIYKGMAKEQGVDVGHILFHISESGDYLFVIYDQNDKYVGTMDFLKKSYQDIAKDILSDAPDLRDDRFDIDEGWAMDVIYK